MNKIAKILIIVIIFIVTLPLLYLVASEAPDWAVSVPERKEGAVLKIYDSESELIGASVFSREGVDDSVDYFVQKIAFVILRDQWTQKIERVTRQTEQDDVQNMLVDVNKHLRNALEITTEHIQNKVDAQEIVNNIVIGATPLGAFSDIYESIDDADTIMKAGREIENALVIAQKSSSFGDTANYEKPYKLEDLIALQAAQYFKYENDPKWIEYFLNWDSNFHEDSNYWVVRNSIERGKGPGPYIKVRCPIPQKRTVTVVTIITGQKHEEERERYCYGFISELVSLQPRVVIRYTQLEGQDINKEKPYYEKEYKGYKFGFTQEELFEPVLGELHGQNVTEISQMKKYIQSKQFDEIPVIRQRISNMRKKLAVPWQPYTMPEPKMESILNEYSYLQKGGLLGLLSEFNESKIRKSSSGEYIYIDEISRIQAFSKLLKSTPTSQDFEKYYNNTQLLTLKKDLEELESKYSSEPFLVLRKMLNFYNL